MHNVKYNSNFIVASRIKSFRLLKGYSQEYLAMRMGVSQNCYSKVELSISKLTIERLLEIADMLEVNVCDLILSQENELLKNSTEYKAVNS